MFPLSIDAKRIIIDNNGNEIVDLTKSIFSMSASAIKNYQTVKMTETYNMRPDKASFNVYGDENFAEMILKYSGISNPFSLGEDDVLMIPEMNTIYNLLATDIDEYGNNNGNNNGNKTGRKGMNNGSDNGNVDDEDKIAQIRNYFKFSNGYKADSTSYDNLSNLKIDSGVIDPNIESSYIVPYISEDGRTSVIIRNGRMYFGEDNGVLTTSSKTPYINGDNLNESILYTTDNPTLSNIYAKAGIGSSGNEDSYNSIGDMGIGSGIAPNINTSNLSLRMQALIDSTATTIADQCAINGMSMVDFTRATIKNGEKTK